MGSGFTGRGVSAHSLPGAFITFEGIDGVGKTSQLDLVERELTGRGVTVVRSFEPGGTDLGQEIRHLLLHRKGEVAPRSEALLYAADRAHHAATKLRPALAAGAVVLEDRFFDSSVAYQGAGRQLDPAEVRALSLWAVENLMPDLTVLLDLPADEALSRRAGVGTEPDRLEREQLDFFERTREEYLKLAAAEPERFLVVSASDSVEAIFARLMPRINEVLRAKGIR